MRFLLSIIAAAALSTAAFASPLIVVTDGDTIWVGEEKIRIIGYDAPETYYCAYLGAFFLTDISLCAYMDA